MEFSLYQKRNEQQRENRENKKEEEKESPYRIESHIR